MSNKLDQIEINVANGISIVTDSDTGIISALDPCPFCHESDVAIGNQIQLNEDDPTGFVCNFQCRECGFRTGTGSIQAVTFFWNGESFPFSSFQ